MKKLVYSRIMRLVFELGGGFGGKGVYMYSGHEKYEQPQEEKN